jgi:hypothetical protein
VSVGCAVAEILYEQTREKQIIVQQQELGNKKYVELQSNEMQEWKVHLKLLKMREKNYYSKTAGHAMTISGKRRKRGGRK